MSDAQAPNPQRQRREAAGLPSAKEIRIFGPPGIIDRLYATALLQDRARAEGGRTGDGDVLREPSPVSNGAGFLHAKERATLTVITELFVIAWVATEWFRWLW